MVDKKILVVIVTIIACVLGGAWGAIDYRVEAEYKAHSAKHYKNKPMVEQVAEERDVITATDEEYKLLEKSLKDIAGVESDKYSMYFWSPIFPKGIVINNNQERAASMIKVYIMAYAMNLSNSGNLKLDTTLVLQRADKVDGAGIIAGWADGTPITIGKLIELMIVESDNTATNMLIDYFGIGNIQNYIVQEGYQQTILQCRMMDFVNPAPGPNYTSVKDLGVFFTKLYNRQCVNEYYDNLMINILKGQRDKEVFPAALPGREIAHKTGEISKVYDEGGIIYGFNNDFVLVIMNHDIGRVEAIKKMQDMVQLCSKVVDIERDQ